MKKIAVKPPRKSWLLRLIEKNLLLSVCVNIAPPALRSRSATDKLLCNIEARPNWPLYADVFDHPQKRLVARRPIWADTTPVDQCAQWEEDWSSAAVVNSHLVCDPTIQQPGFDLPFHSWTLANHFRTGQGPCRAKMHKWGLSSSPLCDFWEQQTMEHIVDSQHWMAAC